MIRITQKDAVAKLQAVLASLGAVPLPDKDGLILITPEQFTKCIDAARQGAIEACMAEQYYVDGGGNRRRQ